MKYNKDGISIISLSYSWYFFLQEENALIPYPYSFPHPLMDRFSPVLF